MNSTNSNIEKLKAIVKPKRSISRRKSLKLLKDAKNVMQNVINNVRHEYIGDRIIAHRSYMNFKESDEILYCRANRDNMDCNNDLSVPSLIENTLSISSGRLLKLTSRHASPSYNEKMKIMFAKNSSSNAIKCSRCISEHPERVLDAPMLSGECWNIIDWNRKGILAVALGSVVYLWESISCTAKQHFKCEDDDEKISCVKWLSDDMNNFLALGSTYGKLSIWKDKKLYKTINTFSNVKITAMAYKKSILSIGFQSGLIKHFDFQKAIFLNNEYHKMAIHQMKWSSNNVYLAVSSEEGNVSIWTMENLTCNPTAYFKENKIGVEDVAWSPDVEHIILYVGGENNTILKMMDVSTKQCIKSFNGNCKMSRVLWSATFNEIAVTYQNDDLLCKIKLYDASSIKMITEMSGHKGEIISMVCNPITGMLTTVGRDECIHFWTCFKDDELLMSKTKQKKVASIMDGFHRFR